MKYLILFAIACPCFAWSSNKLDEPSDLKRLLQARTLDELNAESHLAEEISRKQEECAAELALNVIPRACFAASRLQSKKIEDRLVLECEKRAKKSTSRLDLTLEPQDANDQLPSKCQTAVEVRLADLDYLDPMVGHRNAN